MSWVMAHLMHKEHIYGMEQHWKNKWTKKNGMEEIWNKIWDSKSKEGIRQWNKYLNIKGQIESSLWRLWDKTVDDPGFAAAIETLKCPIVLVNLMRNWCTRTTGAVTGIWVWHLSDNLSGQYPYINALRAVKLHQLVGNYYRRTVESNVETTWQLGEIFTFGIETTLMEPILAGAQLPVTIAACVALNTAGRQPYNALYYTKMLLYWLS